MYVTSIISFNPYYNPLSLAYYYVHFTNEDTEVEIFISLPKGQSWSYELDLNWGPRAHALNTYAKLRFGEVSICAVSS